MLKVLYSVIAVAGDDLRHHIDQSDTMRTGKVCVLTEGVRSHVQNTSLKG